MAYYRLALQSADSDLLIIFVPLDAEGKYDRSGPEPHLLKTVIASNRETYWGQIDSQGVIEWSSGDYQSNTDLFATPVKVRRRVFVPSYYNEHDGAEFVIVDMHKL